MIEPPKRNMQVAIMNPNSESDLQQITVLSYRIDNDKAVDIQSHDLPDNQMHPDEFNKGMFELSQQNPEMMFVDEKLLAPFTFDATLHIKGYDSEGHPSDIHGLTLQDLNDRIASVKDRNEVLSQSEPFCRHLRSRAGNAASVLSFHNKVSDELSPGILNMDKVHPDILDMDRIRDVLHDKSSTIEELQGTLIDIYDKHSDKPLTSLDDLLGQAHIKHSINKFFGPDITASIESLYHDQPQVNADQLERSR